MSRFNGQYIDNQITKACKACFKKYTIGLNHTEEIAIVKIFSTGTKADGSPSDKHIRVSISFQLIAEITPEALASLLTQSYREALEQYTDLMRGAK